MGETTKVDGVEWKLVQDVTLEELNALGQKGWSPSTEHGRFRVSIAVNGDTVYVGTGLLVRPVRKSKRAIFEWKSVLDRSLTLEELNELGREGWSLPSSWIQGLFTVHWTSADGVSRPWSGSGLLVRKSKRPKKKPATMMTTEDHVKRLTERLAVIDGRIDALRAKYKINPLLHLERLVELVERRVQWA